MIALTSLDSLYETKKASEQIQEKYPEAYEALLHVVNLTRQLQFRYHYLGCLLCDEDPGKHSPKNIKQSVIELYIREVNKLKNRDDASEILRLFIKYKPYGYDNLSQLILGKSPEFLKLC
ncbi:hypothetical protein [Pseudalkalibacillus caeni]|uniref:Uncharacterized protein n=1 Tax=Exobacillus caeni TaxID=2574798 RepID=A0A5R9EVE5_9BACL|nr:hypothetical protein [Pseudalkalibacillus caeni]TLS35192.1 hypothetical protein FCL54_21575 [Pseudalkalibacillus caeni]